MKFGIFGGKNEKNIKENDRHFPVCGNGGWHIWHNAGFCRGGDVSEQNTQAQAAQWPTGPEVQASSAVVMDASTGTVLFEKDADTPRYPASITKIMTTLLALENCSLDEVVHFSATAVYENEGGTSHIARDLDEEMTLEQCLYAIMLESANECSYAVAEQWVVVTIRNLSI